MATRRDQRVNRYEEPLVIRRRIMRDVLIGLTIVGLFVLAVVFMIVAKPKGSGLVITVVGGFVVVVAVFGEIGFEIWDWFTHRSIKRMFSRAEAAEFRVCTVCLYPLPGEEGRCPECGVEYTMGDVRASWGRVGPKIASPKKGKQPEKRSS